MGSLSPRARKAKSQRPCVPGGHPPHRRLDGRTRGNFLGFRPSLRGSAMRHLSRPDRCAPPGAKRSRISRGRGVRGAPGRCIRATSVDPRGRALIPAHERCWGSPPQRPSWCSMRPPWTWRAAAGLRTRLLPLAPGARTTLVERLCDEADAGTRYPSRAPYFYRGMHALHAHGWPSAAAGIWLSRAHVRQACAPANLETERAPKVADVAEPAGRAALRLRRAFSTRQLNAGCACLGGPQRRWQRRLPRDEVEAMTAILTSAFAAHVPDLCGLYPADPCDAQRYLQRD